MEPSLADDRGSGPRPPRRFGAYTGGQDLAGQVLGLAQGRLEEGTKDAAVDRSRHIL